MADITKERVLAAHCLLSRDVVLTTDTPETKDALIRSSTWLEVLGQKAKAKQLLYTVLAKSVPLK
ncbi:hypothetical protein FQN51_002841, partial [Onygenales sp. PD_10]